MRCYYDILAITTSASCSEIKKAFHTQALKWHPDKHHQNNVSVDEATSTFQELQTAYQVLSDPKERKWYDEHKEQILSAADEEGAEMSEINLFRYFSTSVYQNHDDGPKGFYAIYRDLFDRLADLEEVTFEYPTFGDSNTDIKDVQSFYEIWSSFTTQRTFAWLDQFKPSDAPRRPIRRAMEKENKKVRYRARRAYVQQVLELVDYIRKRDPRLIEYLRKLKAQKQSEQEQLIAKRKAKKEAFEQARKDFIKERYDNCQDGESTEEGVKYSEFAQESMEQELAEWRRKMNAPVLVCDVCTKVFKSKKQLQNHNASKKHRQRLSELGIDSDEIAINLESELDLLIQQELIERGKTITHQEQEDVGTMQCELKPEVDATQLLSEDVKGEQDQKRADKERKAAEKRKERKDKRKNKRREELDTAKGTVRKR